MKNKQIIRNYIMFIGKPFTAENVAEETDIKPSIVKRVLNDFVKTGFIKANKDAGGTIYAKKRNLELIIGIYPGTFKLYMKHFTNIIHAIKVRKAKSRNAIATYAKTGFDGLQKYLKIMAEAGIISYAETKDFKVLDESESLLRKTAIQSTYKDMLCRKKNKSRQKQKSSEVA